MRKRRRPWRCSRFWPWGIARSRLARSDPLPMPCAGCGPGRRRLDGLRDHLSGDRPAGLYLPQRRRQAGHAVAARAQAFGRLIPATPSMGILKNDSVSLAQVRARFSALVPEAKAGAEKIITKDGKPYVALIDAELLAH